MQRKFLIISFAAALLAFVLSGLVSGALSGFTYIEPEISCSAAIGTFIAVFVCLQFYKRAPKKDSTGMGWGILAGLLSLYFMSIILLLGLSLVSDAPASAYFMLPLSALMFAFFVFCFGGFLAPIIGGYLGNRIAKYLDGQILNLLR